MPELYIGLMSGTSLDGIDAVLADYAPPRARSLAHVHAPFAPDLRAELLSLNRRGDDELRRAALSANELALGYAGAVRALLASANLTSASIKAIGCHGQTVRHQPAQGYT